MSAGIKNLSEYPKPHRPVKAVQFGGGVFLRGFFDWMLQKANDAGAYDGNAVIIRAKTGGEDPLAAQNFLYTHISRDAAHCDATLIDSIETSVNPKDRPEAFFALARSAGLEIVVSNTTEAGIVYHPCPFEENRAPDSYPARLARFLYERYRAGQGGLLILPCELIENNGRALRSAVERHAADWSLPEGFLAWLDRECSFRNTLVDRIVSGAPETPVLLPYADGAVNTGEFFHLWAIEGPPDARLPFAEAGLNVKWVDDVDEYRTLKVRILNGAHTALIPFALLRGIGTVGDCMQNPITRKYLTACLFDEIIPSLGAEKKDEADAYARSVISRFENPYIRHRCEAIALNSVSKFRVRVLPSIFDYHRIFGRFPPHLLFALAQLIAFYRFGAPRDDEETVTRMRRSDVGEVLADGALWGADLTCLKDLLPPIGPEQKGENAIC